MYKVYLFLYIYKRIITYLYYSSLKLPMQINCHIDVAWAKTYLPTFWQISDSDI